MRFSASQLNLLVNCSYSAHPGTWLAPDKPGPAMFVGNAIHKLAEWYLNGEPTNVVRACRLENVRPDDMDRVDRLWASLKEWLDAEIADGAE